LAYLSRCSGPTYLGVDESRLEDLKNRQRKNAAKNAAVSRRRDAQKARHREPSLAGSRQVPQGGSEQRTFNAAILNPDDADEPDKAAAVILSAAKNPRDRMST